MSGLGADTDHRLFLLTVPHAACTESIPVRHCDRAALLGAQTLARALQELGMEVVVAPNTGVLRHHVDMNRPQARGTPWRGHVDEFIAANADKLAFVVDMHSFPLGSPGITHPVTFMTIPPSVSPFSAHVESVLAPLVHARDSSFGHVYGDTTNDIMLMALDTGIRSFIVETSEAFVHPDAQHQLAQPMQALARRLVQTRNL